MSDRYRAIFEGLLEKELLARCIFGEARGETTRGKLAVAHVILNRVAADLGNDEKPDWWGEGIHGVILAPKQFSCFNPADPNCAILAAVDKHPPAPELFACRAVADLAFLGLTVDPTLGANHYHTIAKPGWAKVWPPAWAAKMTRTCSIGGHVFYK